MQQTVLRISLKTLEGSSLKCWGRPGSKGWVASGAFPYSRCSGLLLTTWGLNKPSLRENLSLSKQPPSLETQKCPWTRSLTEGRFSEAFLRGPYRKCLKQRFVRKKKEGGPGCWLLSSSHSPQPLQSTGMTPKIGIQCCSQPGQRFQKPSPAPLAQATKHLKFKYWKCKHSLSFPHHISVLFLPILVNGIDDQSVSPVGRPWSLSSLLFFYLAHYRLPSPCPARSISKRSLTPFSKLTLYPPALPASLPPSSDCQRIFMEHRSIYSPPLPHSHCL